MKAIRVSSTGGPEVLEWADVTDPVAGHDSVVVEVEAAGVNFIDTYQRGGLYPMDLPFVPGLEGAGTIVEVGVDVAGLSIGDRVAWCSSLGSYAEKVAVPAARLVTVPDGVDTATAAAVMLQGLTAHYLASDTFPLAPGDRCLVHAGAGGVGLLLTQIAKRRGAEVFATVGSEDKAELARGAGADHVILYRTRDFGDAVEEIAGPRPLDVVYDGVGRAVFGRSLDLLRPRGMLVQFGNASGPVDPVSPLQLMRSGSLFLTRPTLGDYTADRDELVGRTDDLFGWVRSGELDVRIGATFPLERAAEAHRALEARRTTGKVLLLPR
ncbi:MAG TPA: quinone oxidoreductase [Acidimicrobiia bacterium]|nr:quinone oxidoreductase [Acidimicrobiia bacterium]